MKTYKVCQGTFFNPETPDKVVKVIVAIRGKKRWLYKHPSFTLNEHDDKLPKSFSGNYLDIGNIVNGLKIEVVTK